MGKTTVIRELARVLSDELNKRVVIVDTSNEIGGDGDVPHPAIGGARRMQVRPPRQLLHRGGVGGGRRFESRRGARCWKRESTLVLYNDTIAAPKRLLCLV